MPKSTKQLTPEEELHRKFNRAIAGLDSKLPEVPEAEYILKELAHEEKRLKACTAYMDELKEMAELIQKSKNLPGIRWGDNVFYSRELPGRESWDNKELAKLAVEAGADLEAVKACKKTGKPYITRTFRNLESEG
jgi:hypothetical protein